MNDEEFQRALILRRNARATRAYHLLTRHFGGSGNVLKHADWTQLADMRTAGPATWAEWAYVFEKFGEVPAWLTDIRVRSPEFVGRLENLRK